MTVGAAVRHVIVTAETDAMTDATDVMTDATTDAMIVVTTDAIDAMIAVMIAAISDATVTISGVINIVALPRELFTICIIRIM